MRIIIIGNGAAANQAAQTIQNIRDDCQILIFGHEACPLYSACALPDYLAGWIPRRKLFLKKYRDTGKQDIKTALNSLVEQIDVTEHRVMVNGKWTEYDRLLIATGSRPVIPPLPGSNLTGNFTVKTVADADAILAHNPARVAVVGAGNIGVEVAEVLRLRGCQVDLVEWMQRILPRNFDDRPAAMIKHMLHEHGIRVHTGEKVVEVRGEARVEGVQTDKRLIPCDTVIWAAGVRQNTELAARAGIAIGPLGGIKVDRCMQTSIAGIFACGDCIETFDIVTGQPVLSLLWSSARRQAEIAACNCSGQAAEYEGAFNFILEEIFDQTCLAMGLNYEAAQALNIPVTIQEDHCGDAYFRYLISGERLVGMQAINGGAAMGPYMYMIKSGKAIHTVLAAINNPAVFMKMPWYQGVGRVEAGAGQKTEVEQ